MAKVFFLINIFILFTIGLSGQEISQKSFDSLLSNKRKFYFDDTNKKYFGCGMNIDCMGLPVVFTKINFDKANRQLRLSGYVNPMTNGNGDTIGTNIFKIFIAKPTKWKLKNIRVLVEVVDTVKRKSETTTINLKALSFATDFKFSKGDCLYIESGGLFELKEYYISFLLKPL